MFKKIFMACILLCSASVRCPDVDSDFGMQVIAAILLSGAELNYAAPKCLAASKSFYSAILSKPITRVAPCWSRSIKCVVFLLQDLKEEQDNIRRNMLESVAAEYFARQDDHCRDGGHILAQNNLISDLNFAHRILSFIIDLDDSCDSVSYLMRGFGRLRCLFTSYLKIDREDLLKRSKEAEIFLRSYLTKIMEDFSPDWPSDTEHILLSIEKLYRERYRDRVGTFWFPMDSEDCLMFG